MFPDTHPALTTAIASPAEVVPMRERLSRAVIALAGALAPDLQMKLSEAIAKTSAVDAVIGAYEALRANAADIGPVLRARLIEAADVIGHHGYHGKTDEALSLAADLRAQL